MKRIRQSKLFFREGKSDKVYETDLCQVSDDEYVVNFRYGRRGSALREGTKTVFPVPRPDAEKIFENLVRSKVKKGYKAALSDATAPDVSADTGPASAILRWLKTAVAGQKPKNREWPLSRVIWRAGELKMAGAVPYLVQLADQGDEMTRYCTAWALGRCASEGDDAALKVLTAYHTGPDAGDSVRRIATAALLKLQHQESPIAETLRNALPDDLCTALSDGDPDALRTKLETAPADCLTTLYLLSELYPAIRQVLKDILTDLPLKPGYFRSVRHIFKLAEFGEDHEFHGLLAYRFEKTGAFYRSSDYGYSMVGSEYINVTEEQQKDHPRVAYSDRTRNYLKRRILRNLKQTGEAGDAAAYTGMATELLLMFSDEEDAGQPYVRYEYHYDYDTWESHTERIHHDIYAPCLTFNYILYANSPRYTYKKGSAAWQCVPPWEPGNKAPKGREEAFPRLWEASPDNLLNLLCHSRSGKVHEFAAKAFRDVPDFRTRGSVGQIILMLAVPYAETNRLALTLARKRYSPDQPDRALVLALLRCPYKQARNTAGQWIEDQFPLFFSDTGFVSQAILCRPPDIRAWLRGLLPMADFSDQQQKEIISRVISALFALTEEADDADFIRDVGEMLLLSFPDHMYTLGADVLRDLLSQPSDALQMLGARVLLKHRTPPEKLPGDLFTALLNASSGQVRAMGVQLFGRLSDAILLEKRTVLMSLCISEYPEVRAAIRPIIGRLAATDDAFAGELIGNLTSAFLFKEAYEGVHEDMLALFTKRLSGHLHRIGPDMMWRMIRSKYSAANRLGATLLRHATDPASVTVKQAVALSRHELREIREFAWNYCRLSPERVRAGMSEALGLLDSDWEDSRQFGFDYFRTAFSDADWTPGLLVGICDSVRADVQQFGREMVTRFFDDAHGTEYLLKLSQHPSTDVQLFATNYLERFASGHGDRIEKLRPYFITVLSQVNRGRAAKDRIFRFLKTEALRNEAVARMTSEILERQSPTLAIGDKAACIEILRDIREKYPHLTTRIIVREPEMYGGLSG
ncbi:WGR domain-containing protein [Desulfonema ishimotonii]|uniref:WGR domain-containing protein n=1 Tax=Desulfonema ishimotonii TaxID=45657 RepID=A0A401FXW9_9BACT|nr:hypothetical protein [Desulfonema ishimotonii]GBC61796.1 WGR domain-containing protein [Desulfonema ishimotonii]